MVRKIKTESYNFVKQNFGMNFKLSFWAILLFFFNVLLNTSVNNHSDLGEIKVILYSYSGVLFSLGISIVFAIIGYEYYKANQDKSHLNGSLCQGFTGDKVIKTLVLYLIISLFSVALMFISIIFASLSIGFFVGIGMKAAIVPILLVTIGTFVGFFIYIIAIFSQANFIMLASIDEGTFGELGYIGAIKKSKSVMTGHVSEYIVMNLSLIGWFLLVGITAGLASVFVIPYYLNVRGNYYRYIMESHLDEPLSK